jgi:transposase
MLSLPTTVRVFVSRDVVDFRKSFDGLHAIVSDQFHDDPYSGHYFVFFNRRRDRVKILAWDRNGYWLFAKRLEAGTFEMQRLADANSPRVEIDRAQFFMLLEGIESNSAKRRKHFGSDMRPSA